MEKINSPEDVKKVPADQLDSLCGEIRDFLLENISKTGGHLSSNLGVVELTVAIHRVFDTSRDRLVFDVGHQSYIHKMFTGRKDMFPTLRKLDGMSGFPKPNESVHDAFIAGHASNSISVALGMARARTMAKEEYDVVALIGDGALTGGLAYEGLADAGASGEPMIVILNDNAMSIDPSVGGMTQVLSGLRIRPSYLRFKHAYRRVMEHVPHIYGVFHRIKEWVKDIFLPDTIFEDMGFYYLGPVDGHDVETMERVLHWARQLRQPVLIHAITQKGKGYCVAEYAPEVFHGVGPFDPDTGDLPEPERNFSKVFGETLTECALTDRKIAAITAAMESGTGLTAFAEACPDRFFDVGIAEGHAVAMAAGMAKQGATPVMAVYSCFLQRAYDMLIHDVSLQKLHVVFGVDRAGLVGRDGETHHGVFDPAFLCTAPDMTVFCPSSFAELKSMLRTALYEVTGAAAVRYPRGGEGKYDGDFSGEPVTVLREGSDVTIAAYGININDALEAAEFLEKRDGVSAQVMKLNIINPLDTAAIEKYVSRTNGFVMAEECCAEGSVGQRILALVDVKHASLLNLGNGIVTHGGVEELRKRYGIDSGSIADAVMKMLQEKRRIAN